VVIQLPAGGFLSVLLGGFAPGIVPLAPGFLPVPIAPPVELLRYTFTGAEPPGPYTFLAGFTVPGTLVVVGTLDQDPITFAP
jgi:hypothetical protein